MAYTVTNYAKKKDLKDAVAAGKEVRLFQPGGIGTVPENGNVGVEGPHAPQPHKWYADCTVKNGIVIKVK
jgi:hypothetical protein